MKKSILITALQAMFDKKPDAREGKGLAFDVRGITKMEGIGGA